MIAVFQKRKKQALVDLLTSSAFSVSFSPLFLCFSCHFFSRIYLASFDLSFFLSLFSRDVLKLSKQAIYALHRGDTSTARKHLDRSGQFIKNDLMPITQQFPALRFVGKKQRHLLALSLFLSLFHSPSLFSLSFCLSLSLSLFLSFVLLSRNTIHTHQYRRPSTGSLDLPTCPSTCLSIYL